MSVSELGPYHARSGIDRFLHPRRYGGPNYAAFDVANHFWEWCGGLEAELDRACKVWIDDAIQLTTASAQRADDIAELCLLLEREAGNLRLRHVARQVGIDCVVEVGALVVGKHALPRLVGPLGRCE